MTDEEFRKKADHWSKHLEAILEDMRTVTDSEGKPVVVSEYDQATICHNFTHLIAKIHKDRKGGIILIN